MCVADITYTVSWLIASHTQLLRSSNRSALVEGATDVSAGQPKFDVAHLIDHHVLGAFQSIIDR